jgi:hypothetical protein
MTCAEAFSAFAAKRFVSWNGLHPDCGLEALTAIAPTLNEGVGREPVGRSGRWVSFRAVVFDDYTEPARAWFDGDRLIMLDVDYPQLRASPEDWLRELGDPEARLDCYWDLLALPQGEWAYPSRGLSVLVNLQTRTWLRVIAFAPTTLAAYVDHLRRMTAPDGI